MTQSVIRHLYVCGNPNEERKFHENRASPESTPLLVFAHEFLSDRSFVVLRVSPRGHRCCHLVPLEESPPFTPWSLTRRQSVNPIFSYSQGLPSHPRTIKFPTFSSNMTFSHFTLCRLSGKFLQWDEGKVYLPTYNLPGDMSWIERRFNHTFVCSLFW